MTCLTRSLTNQQPFRMRGPPRHLIAFRVAQNHAFSPIAFAVGKPKTDASLPFRVP